MNSNELSRLIGQTSPVGNTQLESHHVGTEALNVVDSDGALFDRAARRFL